MPRIQTLLLSVPFLLVIFAAEAQPITIGESYTLYSEELGEDREYWISLPESYDNSQYLPQNYPVLYLLDGEARFHSAVGVVDFMSPGINGNGQIPEMIVVAIPNTNRDRDLTPTVSSDGSGGGGDNFLNFIEKELSPQIEATFRASPYRLIVGHSHGGLFAIHSLFERPKLFQSYIVIEPSLWWDNQIMVSRLANRIQNDQALRGSIYLALANNPGSNNPVERAIREFGSTLGGINNETFRSTLQYFENEDHASSPLLSLYHGLLFLFEGYNLFTEDFFMNPSVETITSNYQKLSQSLGWEILPPENSVDQLGNTMLYQVRNVPVAVRIFELNARNYPESYNAHLSLGNSYAENSNISKALEHYETALSLNPNNAEVQSRIQALSGSN